MEERRKRYLLSEEDIPRYWYNIQAEMPVKPQPMLDPATRTALRPEDLYPLFARELCHQELNTTDPWIEIPAAVRDMYKYYRSTPLCVHTGSRPPSARRRIYTSKTKA